MFYELFVCVASTMGITVLVLGFTDGPGAWIRSRIEKWLGRASGVLHCTSCFSFWVGLIIGSIGAVQYGVSLLSTCLIAPLAFYILYPKSSKQCKDCGKAKS